MTRTSAIDTTAVPHCALVRGRLHRPTIAAEIRARFDRYDTAASTIPGKGLNFCLYRDSDRGPTGRSGRHPGGGRHALRTATR